MANNNHPRLFLSVILIAAVSFNSFAQKSKPDPWTQNQLLAPAELAKIMEEGKENPLVYSIGFDALIKGSIDVGAAKEKANLTKFRQRLSKVPKDASIVIYCGCCPFEHCPNIRPAFNLLKEMKFINYKLLSLQHNIKVDWIEPGYPVSK